MGERKPNYDKTRLSKSQSFTALMRRLKRAGFRADFVSKALLPDWWDDRCSEDSNLIQELEIRIARFLNVTLASVRDPKTLLVAPAYAGAQLRRVRDINRDQLAPAIHSAIRIAAAAVRNLRDGGTTVRIPPADPAAWRFSLQRSDAAPKLRDVTLDLWSRGIPVVPLEILPTPSFQGMACIVEDRPVILLGYKHDEPSRAAFVIAHEAEHILAGDCGVDQPVVDEDDISDDSDMEVRADAYARKVLVGDVALPRLPNVDFKHLAQTAADFERRTGADSSTVVFAWARETGDYPTATMAIQALYRASGARRQLLRIFEEHVNVADAPETDRDLLRCVVGTK
jgi:Zn-dependent peptidase ImmA (M78 family)